MMRKKKRMRSHICLIGNLGEEARKASKTTMYRDIVTKW